MSLELTDDELIIVLDALYHYRGMMTEDFRYTRKDVLEVVDLIDKLERKETENENRT